MRSRVHAAIPLALVWLLLICSSSITQADELEELLSGFGDEPQEQEAAAQQELDQQASDLHKERQLPQWLDIQGSLSLQSTLNFSHESPKAGEVDYRGLSMFRTRGELTGDLAFGGWKARLGAKGYYDAVYAIQGRGEYTDELLSEYEAELELTEAYVQTALADNLDIKAGRQIVVWGKSDNIRINDILNPLDLRYPGMVDIRDLRLPVAMTKLDWYLGNWNISAVVIHEPRFNKTPVYNSDFFPGDRPLPPAREPSAGFANQQYGMAVNGVFSGWDLSVYTASVFADRPHMERGESGELVRQYDKALMAGFGANMAHGNWLLKAEAAYWDGLECSSVERDYSRIDFLAGLEYSGFSETLIAVEFADRHIFDFDVPMGNPPDFLQEDLVQSVVRLNRDFMHDTLRLTLLISFYGLAGEDGAFQRLQLDYDLNDDVAIKGGVVLYQSGDYLPFNDIGDNDRIFLELEYRF